MIFKRLAFFLCLATLAACSIPKPSSFYGQPATEAGPGTLIDAQPYSPTIAGAAAYRILYNSTNLHGATIPVSGVVYIPTTPPPPGGRNIIAWAHPTTGAAPGCAPRLTSNARVASRWPIPSPACPPSSPPAISSPPPTIPASARPNPTRI